MRHGSLIRRILAGDRPAGEEFVTANYPRIHRFLQALVGDPDVVRDLTQQTFVKAWSSLASFRGEASLSTWLHQIAYREYGQWLRTRREHQLLDVALDVPDVRSERQFDAVLIRRALGRLSVQHRETVVLFYVQGLSVPELAAVMEVPTGTVKSRLFHARQRLAEFLRDPTGEESNDVPSIQPECETC